MPNYPTPINQFNRLVLVSGSEPTGTYARGSRWNNVAHGRNWDSANCTAAMGAVCIDAHTGGRTKSSPSAIRNNQYDWSGGIGWDDVNVAWARLWPGNQLLVPRNVAWADVLAYLKQGRFVGIQGDNDQMGADSCQSGFTGDHAYGLGGYRASDGRVLLYDPLCTRARWVRQTPIRAAAEKLALVQRGSRGRLFVAVTRPMPSLVPAVHWGSDVPADIRAAYTASAVAAKLRSLGITSYGTAINLSDLEAGLRKRGIDFGTSVQLIDARALMKAGTGS